jgi:AcrR family transcriptional regulator
VNASLQTVSTPADRPLRADARRNRERILAAAQVEFARSGGDAQMDAIAAGAGVGVGTVYRHFPTKDALVAQLIRARFEQFVATAHAALEVEDPWEAFAGFMRANAQHCAQDVGTQFMFLQAGPELAPTLARETGLLDLSQQLIDRGQRAGVLRADFAADDIGMIMCGVASAMHHGSAHWDWQRHLGFVLDGLRARPA